MANTSMVFNVLVKKDLSYGYIAHCLELDIVATSKTIGQTIKDMLDLIETQVNYAFSNDNLDYLYHPAPADVWEEFYACNEQTEEKKIKMGSSFSENYQGFIPQWITARTCTLPQLDYV
jgi:hypothetical protein